MRYKTVNDWIAYHEIWDLLREDLSLKEIAKAINMNLKAVKKYVAMNETDLIKVGQQYFALIELPYGFQAQVDFASFVLRDEKNRQKKIYFFTMTLSRSQMMFICLSDIPFTVQAAIDAHEQAFKFFQGIPKRIIYNQDLFDSTSRNLRKILMVPDFDTYVFEQELRTEFCTKSNPDNELTTHNVIKHVKSNFLSGRVFYDIETLQFQAMGWLSSTGGGMPHTGKNITPLQDWVIEQPYLRSWCTVKILPSYILRFIYKDNTFFYNGKFYPVPNGTYQKKDSFLQIYLREDELHVFDYMQNKFLCKYPFYRK